MTLYDPPSDPYGCAHPCRECDREMVPEWPMARGSARICKNPNCPKSPYYREAEEEAEDA